MHPLAIASALAALMIPPMAVAQDYAQRHSGREGLGEPRSGQPHAPPPHSAPSAYRRWTRGQVLPPASRTGPVTDYGRLHLRRPPRGYQWYRCGDQFVLAAMDSGLVFEVIDEN
jgi:Ni/Co efflux regulator RcnB